ncbi:MAG TPA: ABC transporter substrate-binding protein [Acidimicrobiales bacterium]|nr:ABC transporter substrate-binding protein [Acidimicrobiales bacterium]
MSSKQRRSAGARRRLVAAATAMLVAAPVVVVAGTATGAGAQPSNVNPNGVLKYGFDLNNEFSNDFDPGTGTNDCSYTVLSNVYQSLTAPGNAAIGPNAAATWTVSNNSSTITFHLRPGAVFSNGDPVTSTAVEQSMLHIKKSPQRSSLSAISTIQTPDAQTVVVNLNRPTAGDFLWAMTYLDGMVMNPSNIPNASSQPIGSGPFVLKSYQQGSSILLAKNPKYWDPKAYPLGGVNFVQVTNGPQAVTALTSGAVDMVSVEPENYAELKNNPNIGVAVAKSYDYMVFQMRENKGPFTNPKVRAALEYAVDRNAINKVVFSGLGEPAYQPWPSWSVGYNKSIGNSYTYNPKKAKAMLAAAGFPHGVSFKFIIPGGDATFDRAAAIIQQEMAAAGVTANIQQVPGGDIFTDVYLNHEGDALLSEQLTNGPDISNNYESAYEPTGFAAQQLGTVNNQITPLILKANASLSPSLQGPLMQQVGKTVLQQGLEVPIAFYPSIIAYNKQRVGGTVTAPIGQCRSNLAGIYIKK